MRKILFFILVSLQAFSQTDNKYAQHYINLSVHSKYLFNHNDRSLIVPLSYEYLPAFFNRMYGVGVGLNYNAIKINNQKEFSLGVRNTLYLTRKEHFRPYIGAGIQYGYLQILDTWKRHGGEWQLRYYAGCRVKVTRNWMVFSEIGNYRIGSYKLNIGLGITKTFTPK
ncbi:outer membrane beta-barrel protein [Emticicia agri]|uniref:DUF3575 domain-containing protein n=1 Tax=Emticicia agri TaxID=2492393 RepID=A0A4Q5LWB0_9BACT|nr:outer membrane beta-barrel protein [Emticicia agri]RYU93984.1 hypothetical protein EWM59_19080 [Emticicia agri]